MFGRILAGTNRQWYLHMSANHARYPMCIVHDMQFIARDGELANLPLAFWIPIKCE